MSIDVSMNSQDLEIVKTAVHQELDYSKYDTTMVRETTNCYSHAIGTTHICYGLYRVGAICGLKPVNAQYLSVDEILSLLHADFSVLNLGIESSFVGDILAPNQYQIALFVKIYADKKIHDFHFYRCDSRGWSEKFWGEHPRMMPGFVKMDYFPWHFVKIFKITK